LETTVVWITWFRALSARTHGSSRWQSTHEDGEPAHNLPR
jgi:hypothetical protein